MLPFERITYFIGLAVALLAWGGDQLVERIRSTPIVLFEIKDIEPRHGSAATGRAVATISNLSRTHSHQKVIVSAIIADSATRILGKEVGFSGIEPAWQGRARQPVFAPHEAEQGTRSDAIERPTYASSVDFTIGRMDPGAAFRLSVPYTGKKRPEIYIRSEEAGLRVIGPSVEAFIVGRQFEWLTMLVVLAMLAIVVCVYLALANREPAARKQNGGPAGPSAPPPAASEGGGATTPSGEARS